MGLISPFRMRLTKQKLIDEGDTEATIAFYCLHEFHKFPHEFFDLPRKERAFVIAAINRKIEDDKKRKKEIDRKSRGRRKH